MKTIIHIFLFLSSTALLAQPGERIRERIRAQRVAFITSRLELTPAEAEKFWPIYNQFTDEFEAVKKEMNQLRKSTNENLMSMSDKDIEKALEEDLANQQKITDLQRKYQKELKSAISARKIALLYKTERDFKLQLLKRMRDAGQPPIPDDEF
ncbi:MAG: sensor of ECF-type sigma factor [Bacteroidetes bacterium]|nr:sensor of ECF-type sigma factor [Bacteroidota bacterium]